LIETFESSNTAEIETECSTNRVAASLHWLYITFWSVTDYAGSGLMWEGPTCVQVGETTPLASPETLSSDHDWRCSIGVARI